MTAATVIPFRDPSLPAVGAERLLAIRAYRAGCREIAATAVAQAFSETATIAGAEKIGINDAHPLFIAAMRRELRKTGLF
jgi:hypothetical protein